MAALTKKQYISIFSAVLIVALVYFLPKSPTVLVEGKEEGVNVEGELEIAVSQVLSGTEPPMKGVLRIKELAENEDYKSSATLVLGVFSLMTNQQTKATARFEEFGSKFPLEDRSKAERDVGEILLKHGDIKEMLALLQKYKLTSKDDLRPLLDEIILEFKNI